MLSFVQKIFLCAMVGGVLGLDQISKWATQYYLPLIDLNPFSYPYGGIGVFQDCLKVSFALNHATNTGAAWGLFAEYSSVLFLVRIACIVVLLFYLYYKKLSYSQTVCYFLILTGAIGNILDIFFYDHVIDLFHFTFGSYHFPIFNIADSAISIGVVAIVLQELWLQKKNAVDTRERSSHTF